LPRGFWYPCVVLAVSDTKAKVRFEGTTDPKFDTWVPKALVRRRCRPDNLAFNNARPPAGTLVEVQVPDRWGSDGIADRWSWWPGVVQVYSHHPAVTGQVTVALDLSRDCQQKQLVIPRKRMRIVLPAGKRVRVEGAGVEAVNGIYEAVGFHDGVPMFVYRGVALLRCALPSGSRFWYLCNKNQINVDDGDYYRIYSAEELPPMSSGNEDPYTVRWVVAKDGAEPVPTIRWVPAPDSLGSPCSPAAASQLMKGRLHTPPACPLCSHVFPPGEDSNEDVNAHIDACLEVCASHSCAPSANEEAAANADTVIATGDSLSAGSSGGSRCVVCLDGRADCAAIPCGHMCLCEECAYELKTTVSSCPICRCAIMFAQRIYV